MTPLPDWAQTVADFREHFGPDVRVTHLTIAAAPGWQLGMSVAEGAARHGLELRPYDPTEWAWDERTASGRQQANGIKSMLQTNRGRGHA